MAIFTTASLACGIAPGAEVLVIARLLVRFGRRVVVAGAIVLAAGHVAMVCAVTGAGGATVVHSR